MVNVAPGGFNLIILNIRKHFVMIRVSQQCDELLCEGNSFMSLKALGKCWQGLILYLSKIRDDCWDLLLKNFHLLCFQLRGLMFSYKSSTKNF